MAACRAGAQFQFPRAPLVLGDVYPRGIHPPDRVLLEHVRNQLLDRVGQPGTRTDDGKEIGTVLLVGAGPGDPELLTLKAVRALQSADVVLFDDLVSPAIVDMARREATRITVGKRGHRPSCGQDEISALLVKLAKEERRRLFA